MKADNPKKLLPFSVVRLTKNSAPKLKEILRSTFPPIFNAFKSAFAILEGVEVDKALQNLDRMREMPLQKLTDVQFLENFIIDAGLHASGGDGNHDSIDYEWPKSLDAYVGKGLQTWQYPIQYGKYLVFLSQFQIKSHLEIGVAYGGAFVFSTEYLNRFNAPLSSYCIDVVPPSLLVEHYAKKRKLTYITAKSSDLYNHIDPQTKFDLVFVDGDHSKEGVMRDFALIKDKADIIAFHDIVNFKTLGAIEAWDLVKHEHQNDFDFFEFTEQYPDILNKQPGKSLFGIGVAVKKALGAKSVAELTSTAKPSN
ncbi:MAG: class I SAM-dependent methyltransferase [Cyanobacteriota bacterium]|nr:class I SAM-dependent methyltransferase [Cyanobacteriota bacterium]